LLIVAAGTTINIMPNTAEISYVARSLLHGPAKEQYFEAIKQEISRVCAIYNKKDEPGFWIFNNNVLTL
jgi:metal-dependent amidase/aminoacylase/carboxypeptidase family protein